MQADFSKIRLRTEADGRTFEGAVLEQRIESIRLIDGQFLSHRARLQFPEPTGLAGRIAYVFLPDALQVNSRLIAVSPFRFSRVTKQDVYYGSINC